MLNKLTKEDLTKQSEIQQPLVPEVRGATTDEKEGDWDFTIRQDGFTDQQVEVLFPLQCLKEIKWFTKSEKDKKAANDKVRTTCQRLHLWPVETFTIIKDRKALTYSATESYPVFLIDEEKFKVVYQPLHPDPESKYIYIKEPKKFIHGLKQAQTEINKREDETKPVIDPEPSDAPVEKKKFEKIKEIILVNEAAEGFGLALMDYFVCWISGKNAKLEAWDFINIAKNCKKVYQVRNNTAADKKFAHERALANLDLFTIELPEALTQTIENQTINLPVVNLVDYFQTANDFQFKELLQDALPYRFWEMFPRYTGPKDNRVFSGYKYDFDSVQAYNFLNKMGIYRLPVEGRKTDYIYIQQDGNIIRERTPNKVKNFVHEFLEDRRLEKDLRNMLFESTRLNESSLSNLKETEIDFTDNDEHRQYLFFQNGTLEVTADEIKIHPQGDIDRFVWERDVIEHDISRAKPAFTISKMPDGSYDIKVNHYDDLFFNYLIQTSRIHWRKELEVELSKKSAAEQEAYLSDHKFEIDSDLLSDEERYEQKQHLINKIFALGHVLHRHKSRSKTWAIVGTDDKISRDGKSHGGSGKSLCFNQALSHVYKSIHSIPGTNPNITQNPHIFHGLTKDHKALIIDDADAYLNFRFFFEFITSDQVVNNKNGDIFKIPFEQLCKMIWLTNFSFSTDPSTARRILYTVFSDYYHQKGENNDYRETREPKNDFGKELFTQFDESEFNHFYNTIASCLQFYLQCPVKLNPPMSNVNKRKLQREMGTEFENWAGVYFNPIAGNLDKYFVKEEAYTEFMRTVPRNFIFTTSRFKTACEAYCKYHGLIFNPEQLINSKADNRIIHMVADRQYDARNGQWNESDKKKAKELFYIQTNFDDPLNLAMPGAGVEPLPF